jgi:hypothetical protein
VAVLIPKNKSEVILDIAKDAGAVIEKDIVIEGDALSFVVIMEDVPAGSNLNIDVFELKNQTVITPPVFSTGVISGVGISKRFAGVVNNTLRMRISFTGPANFVILAKTITAAGVTVVNQQTSGALAGPGVEGVITVTAVPKEVKVGDAALQGRALVIAYNASSDTMYWGRTAAVDEESGIPLFKNQVASWAFTDTAKIYVMTPANGGGSLRVTESKLYV